MSDIEAIYRRLDRNDERFGRGEEKFAEVNESIKSIKDHLTKQDETMATFLTELREIRTGTDSIVATWEGGEKAVRFFCRMAEAWTFLLRKVFIPVVLPLAGLWTVLRVVNHQALPDWFNAVIKVILAIL